MKKAIAIMICAVLLAALGGCEFLMGPDNPAGSGGAGDLSISFGTAGLGNERALSAGAELPRNVLDSLTYKLVLTGPGGEPPLERTVSGGEKLKLTAALGDWRIDATAWQGDGLAGTGALTFTVIPGFNAIWIPMTINEGYFDITADGIIHGTVTADFSAAFPGTTVTLELIPNDGFVLKSGSLKVNGDTVVPAVEEEDIVYRFTMPAADVTIGAVFNPYFGIAIGGPEDLAEEIEITVSHSVDGPLAEGGPIAISWSEEESLSFTVAGGYTVEDGNLMWIEGNLELYSFDPDSEWGPITGNSLTINAVDCVIRTYNLTVMVKENEQWYSTNIPFAVEG
jgi:hypothetical protein